MIKRDRIKETFQRIRDEDRPGLILFLTPGYPDWDATRELVPALVEAGADAIELSIPFSDPLADGPVIQESTFLALERGVTPPDCLELVSDLRDQVPDTPLVFMTYYNPILNYGMERFASDASAAGVDGLIGVDIPITEIRPLEEVCQPRGNSPHPPPCPHQHRGQRSGFRQKRHRVYLLCEPHRRYRRTRPGLRPQFRAARPGPLLLLGSPVRGVWHLPPRACRSRLPPR